MNSKDTKREVFRKFWYLKENGQVFPFLVVIIVLMLVAVMAFINTGQVNLRKVSTMNAADAAALAGASQLASAANQIAAVNADLMTTYFAELAIGSQNFENSALVWGRFTEFMLSAANNLRIYMQLCITGFKAVQHAGGSAVQMAFSNMPIDEAARREAGSGEEGELGDLKKPGISEYLDNIDIYTENTMLSPPPYEWDQYSYDIAEDKQVKVPGEKVKVEVKKPDENTFVLIPAPPLPQFTMFWYSIPPCTADGCGACAAYIGDTIVPARTAMVDAMVFTREFLFALYGAALIWDFIGEYRLDILNNILGIIFTAIGVSSFCMYGPTICGMTYFDLCTFFMPLPFIAKLEASDAEVSVWVTRFSPVKDLGLYRFKEQEITSSSRAGMTGGSVMHPGSYKIRTHEVK